MSEAEQREEPYIDTGPRLRVLKLRYCCFPVVFVTRRVSEDGVKAGFSSLTRRVTKSAQLQNLRVGSRVVLMPMGHFFRTSHMSL